MFAARYFAPRYFAPRYFPPGGDVETTTIITASGDAGIQVFAGTSWNPNWASDYGPDVDRARKAREAEVQRAKEALTKAPDIEPIEDAQSIARRSLASELMSNEADKIALMTAYYEYVRWRKRRKADDEKAAELLLL